MPLRFPSPSNKNLITSLLAAGFCLNGMDACQAVTPLDFAKDVLPLLERSCLPCHNATKSEGELNIETPQLMLKGGENGPVIKPNHAQDSTLYRTAAHLEKPFMPPAENKSKAVPLTSLQLEILRRWLDEGAVGHGKERQAPAWQPMPGRMVSISAVAVTEQGTVAAAARGQQVTLYDVTMKAPLAALPVEAHHDVVSALAFSPDGTLLATGSFGELKLWKLQPANISKCEARLAPQSAIEARSPDGVLVASAPPNAVARISTANGRKVVAELRQDRAQLEHLSALELALSGAEFELLYQKDELKKAEQQQTAFEEEAKRATAEQVDFTKRKAQIEKQIADAKTRVTTLKKALDESMARLTAATRAKEKAELVETAARDAARSADQFKDKAPAADKAKAEQAWKDAKSAADKAAQDKEKAVKELAEADKKLKQATTDHNEASKALNEAMGEAGKAIDAERTARKAADDAKNGKAAVEQFKKEVAAAQTARDLAAKAKEESSRSIPLAPSPFAGIVFSADGQQVISSHEDGCVRTWSAASGKALATWRADAQKLGPLAIQNDQLLVAKADGSVVALGLTPRWTQVLTVGDGTRPDSPLTDRVNAIAFSPDGKRVATGSGDPSRSGEIKLWDATSGKLIKEFAKPHKDAVLSLSFSADGRQLASGSADRAVRIWDAATGNLIRNLEAHGNQVLAVNFRHDGRRLASAGADNNLRIWNLLTGDVVKTISDVKKEFTGIQYVEHRDVMLASSGDPLLRVLNEQGGTAQGKLASINAGSFKAYLTASAASPDGKVEVVGDAAGELWIFDGEGHKVASFPASPSP